MRSVRAEVASGILRELEAGSYLGEGKAAYAKKATDQGRLEFS